MTRRAHAAAVLAWLLLSIVAAWLLFAHTRITTDLTVFLPHDASPVERVLVEQLRDGVASRLTLIALSGASEDALARSSKALAEKLRQDKRFGYVANGENVWGKREQALLWQHRYQLSPAVNSAEFTVSGLRRALEARLADMGSALGMLNRDTLSRDPTDDYVKVLSQWSAQGGPNTRQDVWFSPDGKRALLLAESRAPGFDLDAQAQVAEHIRHAFDATRATPTMRILLSGPGIFGVEARDRIQNEASRLSLVDVAFLAFLLWLVYRSGRLIVLSMVPILSGALFAAAAVSLVFGSIHGITLGFGSTLIGVANDYPIHLFTHILPGERIQDTIRRIWPTLRLGVTATIAGFASLLFSDFTGLAQLGLFAIVGLLAAGLVTRWVLPAFTPADMALPSWAHFNPVAIKTLARLQRLRWLPVLFMGLAIAYLLFGGKRLWDDNLSNLNTVSPARVALDTQLRSELGAPELSTLIVVMAPSAELALQRSEALAAGLKTLAARKQLDGFDMAALYLPSQATQRQRQAALPDAQRLRAALQEAGQGLPFKAGVFGPFVQEVAQARQAAPMTLAALGNTSLAMKVKSLLFNRDGQWIALVPLKGQVNEAALRAFLARQPQLDAHFLNLQTEATRMVAHYRGQALTLSLWGALAIVGLLALGIRSARGVLRVLFPMLAAVSVVAAIIVMGGRGMTLFHLVSLLLVVGISMDYGLFFNHEIHAPEEVVRTLLSLVVCSLTTIVAFGVLVTSDAFILQAIGMTVALGSAFALLFAAMMARRQTA